MTAEFVPLCLALLVESVIRDGHTYATLTVDGVDWLTLAPIAFDADGLPVPLPTGGAMASFNIRDPQSVRRAAIIVAHVYAKHWTVN